MTDAEQHLDRSIRHSDSSHRHGTDGDHEIAGRRERKKQATRDALQAAAYSLVLERGLHNVTVEDIAEAVDVSERTFFNHFPTKEAALLGFDSTSYNYSIADCIASRPADEPMVDAICAVLVDRAAQNEVIAGNRDGRARLRAKMAIVHSEPSLLGAVAAAAVETEGIAGQALAKRAGLSLDDPLPQAIAAAALATARSVMMSWAAVDDHTSLASSMRIVLDAFANGFRQAERTPNS